MIGEGSSVQHEYEGGSDEDSSRHLCRATTELASPFEWDGSASATVPEPACLARSWPHPLISEHYGLVEGRRL